MNGGGKAEIKREKEKGIKEIKRVAADEFGRAVAKMAVAQICESVGFQSFNESALEALADIAVRYMKDTGKTASFYANLANRTECNVFDIIQGLEDLGSSTGFSGGSEISGCLTESGAIKGIIEYVESAEEIPFAQPVPQFPVNRNRRGTPSFVQMCETPGFKHVPDWLPAFPDPHTYIHTPVWNERATDPRADKIELARQRRKAESSLLSLQQRLVSSGSIIASTSRVVESESNRICAMASTSAGVTDAAMELHLVESKNPFLAPPIQGEEKDAGSVALPTKISSDAIVENHISLLEAFAPAIEAVSGRASELGDSLERSLPEKRSAVHLNFKIGKKMVGESLDLRLWNKGSARMASWFGRDDDKDDKKRRAELILRQSVENPHELTHL